MAESSLQPWMQWRLLQPVEASLVEGDLERWGQWWQGSEGQAFWQSCKWLWYTFGQHALDSLLLYIEAALAGMDLHRWVQQWKQGDKTACWQVCERLWQKFSAHAARFLYYLIDDDLDDQGRLAKAHDLAESAFWAALEELDLKVSGGQVLTVRTDKTKERRLKDKKVVVKKIFKGTVSERELTEREPLVWLGLARFEALFGDILVFRCQDALRHEEHYFTAAEGKEENTKEGVRAEGKDPKPDKKSVKIQHTRLQGTGNDESEDGGGAHEDEIAGEEPDGETWTLNRDGLRAFGKGYEQVAAQLRSRAEPALAEVADTLYLHLKTKIAVEGLASRGETRLQDPKFIERVVNAVQGWTLEALLRQTDVQTIEINEKEQWAFVQDTLGLSQDGRYKRKERLLDKLSTLPQIPQIFGSLWHKRRK